MKVKNNKKMIIVLGSSRFGASIASLVSEEGFYTAIVDKNELSFKKLNPSYSGYVVLGDAMDQNVLEKANIEDAREVIISTSSDNTNIFLALMIDELYHPESIVVRLRDDQKTVLLDRENIHIIATSQLSLQAFRSISVTEEAE